MNRKKKIIVAFASVAVVLAGLVGFEYVRFTRTVRHPTLSESGANDVEAALKGAASDIVVLRQSRGEQEPSPGLIEAYRKDPARFKSNAKYFDTWLNAAELGNFALENARPGNWVRSSTELQVPGSKSKDAWGHSYCVMRRDSLVLVISAGPNAEASPRCKDIEISGSELAKMPKGRLLETPAHSLALVVSAAKE